MQVRKYNVKQHLAQLNLLLFSVGHLRFSMHILFCEAAVFMCYLYV